ncbi:MAG: hypothetical protein C4527_19540 [Candidatus Omnitrophota bacterium]|jgi:hypothetical protein|nr:MAG: hypothetical protein C4527_19540 [Candidatus Omnitrophota bacterium]
MNIFRLGLCLFFVAGFMRDVVPHPTSLDEDGMLSIAGERQFVLGLYQTADSSEDADEIAQAGFNLIRVNATKEALDLAHEHHLQCWIPLGGVAVSSDAQKASLKSVVETYKDHSALAIWEGPDEILWNVWWLRWNRALKRWDDVGKAIQQHKKEGLQEEELDDLTVRWLQYRSTARYAQAEEIEEEIRKIVGLPTADERLSEWRRHLQPLYDQLVEGTTIVRQNDPNHVIWFNHAPRNSLSDLQWFGKVADVVGCDIYPVPFGPTVGHSDLAERNLASVGAFTRRMALSAPGKPVWMVLQGFGWDDLRESAVTEPLRPRPTLQQTRYMAYDAIANRARGILYWGTHAIERESQLWNDIKTVVSELHALQPFLSAPDANERVKLIPHPSSGSDEKGIVWLAKENDGRWAFFVVNESDQAISFDLKGLDGGNDAVIEILNSAETIPIRDGCITYGLPAVSAATLLTGKTN